MVEKATTLLLAHDDPSFLQHRPIHRGTRDRGRHSLNLVACRCPAFARAAGRRRGRGDEAADHRVDRVPGPHRGGQSGQCHCPRHCVPGEAALHRGCGGQGGRSDLPPGARPFRPTSSQESASGAVRSDARQCADHDGPPAHAAERSGRPAVELRFGDREPEAWKPSCKRRRPRSAWRRSIWATPTSLANRRKDRPHLRHRRQCRGSPGR